MIVTSTECKNKFGHFLDLITNQPQEKEIFISRNGLVIAKIIPVEVDRWALISSMYGLISDDITLEDSKIERINGGNNSND